MKISKGEERKKPRTDTGCEDRALNIRFALQNALRSPKKDLFPHEVKNDGSMLVEKCEFAPVLVLFLPLG